MFANDIALISIGSDGLSNRDCFVLLTRPEQWKHVYSDYSDPSDQVETRLYSRCVPSYFFIRDSTLHTKFVDFIFHRKQRCCQLFQQPKVSIFNHFVLGNQPLSIQFNGAILDECHQLTFLSEMIHKCWSLMKRQMSKIQINRMDLKNCIRKLDDSNNRLISAKNICEVFPFRKKIDRFKWLLFVRDQGKDAGKCIIQ